MKQISMPLCLMCTPNNLYNYYISQKERSSFFGTPFFFLRREGFEGTDLAALARLEHPYSATGIQCNPK